MEALRAFGLKFTNCCCIPQYFILGIMASLSTFTAYTMRVTISMGITEMVQQINSTDEIVEGACTATDNTTTSVIYNQDTVYDWSEKTQGLILSSFYWGYFVTHIPGALLAENFGGKHILGIGILVNSVLTLLTPAVIISTNGNYVALIVMRCIMGMCQGVVWPVCANLIAQWISPKIRATFTSITFAGSVLGTVVSNSLSGILIQATHGWSIIFYFFGLLGLLWNILWQLFGYSYPRSHPCLKQSELEYIEKELGDQISKEKLKTPWMRILLSKPVWALVVGQLGHNWGWFVMVTDLPKYMSSVLGFKVMQNGIYSSLPYLGMWISAVGVGRLVDWIILKDHLSIRATRYIIGSIGHVGPAIFIVLASYVGCDKKLAVTMFTLAMICMGCFFSGMKVNTIDISPNFAGTIVAIVNGVGALSAIFVPTVIGYMAPEQTLSQWRMIFWVTFVIMTGSNIVFMIFMSPNVQSWNNPLREQEQERS